MANDELKQIRKEQTKDAIKEHQMATTGGTQTTLLQCGKCKKRNCTYNQVSSGYNVGRLKGKAESCVV